MSKLNDESQTGWEELDWADLTKRLLAYVKRHWHSLPWEILHGGLQPEDLVQQAIVKSLTEVRQKPANVSPFQFLAGVIRSDISALLRNKENASTKRVGQNSESGKEPDIAQIASSLNEVEREFLAREYAEEREKILAAVCDDKLLHDIVETILDDNIYAPRVIASIRGVTVRDVYNAKKRGQRKLRPFVHRVEET